MSTVLAKRPVGAPPIPYDPAIAEELCNATVISTLSIKAICDAKRKVDPLWPSESVIRRWLTINDEFNENYARARQQQMHVMADEVIEISDNANADLEIATGKDGKPYLRVNGEAIQRSKLRTDNRKWLMSMLAPRTFGDKLDITSDGKALPAPSPLVIDARVQTIMLAAQRRRDADRLLED
jgi:hypothetical protein